MNHIKQICKDPVKVEQKLQGKEFLLGKYFNLKSDCSKCNKDKPFPCMFCMLFSASKRQKLLQIQHKLNQEQFLKENVDTKNQPQFSLANPFQKQQEHPKGTQIIEQKDEHKKIVRQQSITPNYEYFLPLHRLWRGYIQDLIANEKNEQSACLKLLRSDFVGAEIQVVYSKVGSYIGKTGIVIKETLKTFVIVKKLSEKDLKDERKSSNCISEKAKKNVICLLKNEIIFRVQCGQKHYLVNGNTLVYRPSDRSKHKFKSRMGEKLNLDFLADFMEQQKNEV